jgi:two-component system sensor histidine kinase TctE
VTDSASRYSLRRLLLSRLLIFLLPLIVITLVGAYFVTYYYTNVAFDRSLARRAYALADQVVVRDGKAIVDLPQSAHEILEFDSTDVLYYRVVGPDGEHLAGSDDFPLPALLPDISSRRAIFYDVTVEGEPVRAAAYMLSLRGTTAKGNVLVIAGETKIGRASCRERVS